MNEYPLIGAVFSRMFNGTIDNLDAKNQFISMFPTPGYSCLEESLIATDSTFAAIDSMYHESSTDLFHIQFSINATCPECDENKFVANDTWKNIN